MPISPKDPTPSTATLPTRSTGSRMPRILGSGTGQSDGCVVVPRWADPDPGKEGGEGAALLSCEQRGLDHLPRSLFTGRPAPSSPTGLLHGDVRQVLTEILFPLLPSRLRPQKSQGGWPPPGPDPTHTEDRSGAYRAHAQGQVPTAAQGSQARQGPTHVRWSTWAQGSWGGLPSWNPQRAGGHERRSPHESGPCLSRKPRKMAPTPIPTGANPT